MKLTKTYRSILSNKCSNVKLNYINTLLSELAVISDEAFCLKKQNDKITEKEMYSVVRSIHKTIPSKILQNFLKCYFHKKSYSKPITPQIIINQDFKIGLPENTTNYVCDMWLKFNRINFPIISKYVLKCVENNKLDLSTIKNVNIRKDTKGFIRINLISINDISDVKFTPNSYDIYDPILETQSSIVSHKTKLADFIESIELRDLNLSTLDGLHKYTRRIVDLLKTTDVLVCEGKDELVKSVSSKKYKTQLLKINEHTFFNLLDYKCKEKNIILDLSSGEYKNKPLFDKVYENIDKLAHISGLEPGSFDDIKEKHKKERNLKIRKQLNNGEISNSYSGKNTTFQRRNRCKESISIAYEDLMRKNNLVSDFEISKYLYNKIFIENDKNFVFKISGLCNLSYDEIYNLGSEAVKNMTNMFKKNLENSINISNEKLIEVQKELNVLETEKKCSVVRNKIIKGSIYYFTNYYVSEIESEIRRLFRFMDWEFDRNIVDDILVEVVADMALHSGYPIMIPIYIMKYVRDFHKGNIPVKRTVSDPYNIPGISWFINGHYINLFNEVISRIEANADIEPGLLKFHNIRHFDILKDLNVLQEISNDRRVEKRLYFVNRMIGYSLNKRTLEKLTKAGYDIENEDGLYTYKASLLVAMSRFGKCLNIFAKKYNLPLTQDKYIEYAKSITTRILNVSKELSDIERNELEQSDANRLKNILSSIEKYNIKYNNIKTIKNIEVEDLEKMEEYTSTVQDILSNRIEYELYTEDDMCIEFEM